MTDSDTTLGLYIVVHHPTDHSHPYANQWADSRSLQAFTTPKNVALAAIDAGVIFVHRCGYGGEPPTVVCVARVLSAVSIDARGYLVRLEPLRTLDAVPPRSPGRGQNSYQAPILSRRPGGQR